MHVRYLLIAQEDLALQVGQHDAIGRSRHQATITSFTLTQRILHDGGLDDRL